MNRLQYYCTCVNNDRIYMFGVNHLLLFLTKVAGISLSVYQYQCLSQSWSHGTLQSRRAQISPSSALYSMALTQSPTPGIIKVFSSLSPPKKSVPQKEDILSKPQNETREVTTTARRPITTLKLKGVIQPGLEVYF